MSTGGLSQPEWTPCIYANLKRFTKPCDISQNLPEIDADRRDVSVAEGPVDELAEEARLPDAGVAQKEKLEEVVVFHVSERRCGRNSGAT